MFYKYVRTKFKLFIYTIIVKMKRTRGTTSEEPVEEHDSGFVGPMTVFDTFPYNDTFEETRELNIISSPPTATAEVYTFMHNQQDYGVIKTGYFSSCRYFIKR